MLRYNHINYLFMIRIIGTYPKTINLKNIKLTKY